VNGKNRKKEEQKITGNSKITPAILARPIPGSKKGQRFTDIN
jgi:hypothetical protein